MTEIGWPELGEQCSSHGTQFCFICNVVAVWSSLYVDGLMVALL